MVNASLTPRTALSRYVLLCVPALVYVLVAAYTNHDRNERLDQLAGDEGAYLLAAQSIVEDSDVDLNNNAQKFGSMGTPVFAPHCILQPYGWFSVHNLGLSAFVAVPWALAGPAGARLMIALCCGLVGPLLYRTMNAVWNQPRGSLWIALSLSLGMPLIHASSQIYPDLPAGILLLFLAGRALTADVKRKPLNWSDLLAPAALAFLPWLHIKYAAPALVALGWHASVERGRRSLLDGAAFGMALMALACYNWYAFGKPTGPYTPGALIAGSNSFRVFMGLHFDQTQGIFLQQPLWLLGLLGLAPMWRASWRTGVCWTLLYCAAIVPNAMHPFWYGGFSYVGRFGATAVLLWAIPLAYAARSLFAANDHAAIGAALASFALQLCLAKTWLTAGEALLTQDIRVRLWRPCIWAYNGFYPYNLRDHLPYWQPDLDCWRHPANLSALIVAGGLLACGLCLPRRLRLASGCCLATAIAAVLYTAVMPVGAQSAVCTGDRLFDFFRRSGRTVGTQHVAEAGVHAEGPAVKEHAFFPSPGDYRITVDYQSPGQAEPVGHVMFQQGTTLATLSSLGGAEGPQQNVATLHVPRNEAGHPSAVVIWYTARATLAIDQLTIEKIRK